MAAPSLISVTATAVNTATSPKTTASISVEAGDVLVAFAGVETGFNSGLGLDASVNIADSGSNTWTRQQTVGSGNNNVAYVTLWTASAATSGSITVSFAGVNVTGGGSAIFFGGEVHVWRGSDGVGNTNIANNGTGSGLPSVSVTTTQANSGLSAGSVDWNATTGTSTWTSTAGAVVERLDFADGVHYGFHTATYADVSAVGSKTVGMSAPSGQRYGLVVVEVKGSAGGGSQSLTAGSGTFGVTGRNVALGIGETVGSGTFSVTGRDVSGRITETIGSGTFGITGQPVPLGIGEAIGSGTDAITGRSVGFGITLNADSGTFNITGRDVTLSASGNAAITAGSGTFGITGRNVAFGVTLNVDSGTFDIAGRDVELTQSSSNVTLDASTGFFGLTGIDVALSATGQAAQPPEVNWPRIIKVHRRKPKEEKEEDEKERAEEALEALEERAPDEPDVDRTAELVRDAIEVANKRDLARLTSLLTAAAEAQRMREVVTRAFAAARLAERILEDEDEELLLL